MPPRASLYLYTCPKRKDSLLLLKVLTKTRLWGLSWAVFEVYHEPSLRFIMNRLWRLSWAVFEIYHDPVLTKPWKLTNGLVLYQTRPSGLVSFSFEIGILVSCAHGGQRIPISRREADSHLTGFAWHYLTEFCWPNIAKYYSLRWYNKMMQVVESKHN